MSTESNWTTSVSTGAEIKKAILLRLAGDIRKGAGVRYDERTAQFIESVGRLEDTKVYFWSASASEEIPARLSANPIAQGVLEDTDIAVHAGDRTTLDLLVQNRIVPAHSRETLSRDLRSNLVPAKRTSQTL